MDARMQKHRKTRWMGRLFVVLSLVVSWGAQAALESVPLVSTWCETITSIGGTGQCGFPTDLAAAQHLLATVSSSNYYNLFTVTSCDGNGFCNYCDTAKVNSPSGPAGTTWCWIEINVPYQVAFAVKKYTCPVPIVNPTVPYSYNPTTGMCVREAQCLAPNVINPTTGQCEPPETYTITIEPSGTSLPSNGTYTILPSTALPLYAVVKDQNGLVQSGKQVSLTVSVQTGTDGVPDGNGGHIHKDNRPKGKFACSSVWDPGSETATCALTTDGSGKDPFIFIPTAVSGAHTITATCSDCGNTATAPVNVKVDNLITIPASPLYALSDSNGVIGAIPGKHTDNHYLTSSAITKLKQLASIYIAVNPGAKLYLNDASLVWGGLFDVGSTPWVSPHSLHDKGRSLDIRAANSGPNNEGSVPATFFLKFVSHAQQKGFNIGLHCKNSTDTNYCLGQPNNRHFHVDF